MKETIIVGAGISGLSAGIYAARKRMDYTVIAEEIGGQMYESGEVLNYPGVVEATGAEFAETFKKQIEKNDMNVAKQSVTDINDQGDHWTVHTKDEVYESKTVILATGSYPRKLDVPGEERLAKKGVTYCAICDGPLFSDQDVAIVGGGNSALEAVDFMGEVANQIHVINIEKDLGGHAYLRKRAHEMDNIAIHSEAATTEINGEDSVEGITFEQNGETKQLDVAGVIIEIGRIPNTDLVADMVDRDEHNHVQVDRWSRCLRDGEPSDRIYAAGDCTDVHEYQYAIGAGMGVTALLKAVRWLAKNK